MGEVMNTIGSWFYGRGVLCYGRYAEALYVFNYRRVQAWGALAAVCFGAAAACGSAGQCLGGGHA